MSKYKKRKKFFKRFYIGGLIGGILGFLFSIFVLIINPSNIICEYTQCIHYPPFYPPMFFIVYGILMGMLIQWVLGG